MIIQSLVSAGDMAWSCCGGEAEAEAGRCGDADDARDEYDDTDADRDLALSPALSLPLSLALSLALSLSLSLASLSDSIFARGVLELPAFSLQHNINLIPLYRVKIKDNCRDLTCASCFQHCQSGVLVKQIRAHKGQWSTG